MKKNIIFIVAAVILSAALFTASHFSEKIKFSYYDINDDVTTLRLASTWDSQNEKDSVFLELIAKFNSSHSNVYIENDCTSGSDYFSKIESDFSSGNEPDIFISWPNEEIRRLAEYDKIITLSGYLMADKDYYTSFDKSVWKYVSNANKIYGLPLECIFTGFYCNMDVLNSVGISSAPQTFDELVYDIEILKKNNIIPISVSLQPDGILIYEAIAASIQQNTENNIIYSNADGICDYYKKAAEYVKVLYEKGAFPNNFLTISDYEAKSLFLNKQAAFTLQYSDFMSNAFKSDNLQSAEEISLSNFPIFASSDGERKPILYGVGANTFYVSSKSWENPKKQAGIFEFLRFFTSKTSMVSIARARGSFPSVKLSHSEIYPENFAYQQNYSFRRTVTEFSDFPNSSVSPEKLLQIYERFPYYLNNSMSIDEVWSDN